MNSKVTLLLGASLFLAIGAGAQSTQAANYAYWTQRHICENAGSHDGQGGVFNLTKSNECDFGQKNHNFYESTWHWGCVDRHKANMPTDYHFGYNPIPRCFDEAANLIKEVNAKQ